MRIGPWRKTLFQKKPCLSPQVWTRITTKMPRTLINRRNHPSHVPDPEDNQRQMQNPPMKTHRISNHKNPRLRKTTKSSFKNPHKINAATNYCSALKHTAVSEFHVLAIK